MIMEIRGEDEDEVDNDLESAGGTESRFNQRSKPGERNPFSFSGEG